MKGNHILPQHPKIFQEEGVMASVFDISYTIGGQLVYAKGTVYYDGITWDKDFNVVNNEFVAQNNSLFLDAEKGDYNQPKWKADMNLCWVASVSNALSTGKYGLKAPPDKRTEDVTLDFFRKFVKDGGDEINGFGYYFGTTRIPSRAVNAPMKYSKAQVADMVRKVEIQGTIGTQQNRVLSVKNAMDKGCSATLGFYYVNSKTGEVEGGHAVTIAGFALDTGGNLTGFFLADSDNSLTNNPYTAPNTITYSPVSIIKWKGKDVFSVANGVLGDITVCTPMGSTFTSLGLNLTTASSVVQKEALFSAGNTGENSGFVSDIEFKPLDAWNGRAYLFTDDATGTNPVSTLFAGDPVYLILSLSNNGYADSEDFNLTVSVNGTTFTEAVHSIAVDASATVRIDLSSYIQTRGTYDISVEIDAEAALWENDTEDSMLYPDTAFAYDRTTGFSELTSEETGTVVTASRQLNVYGNGNAISFLLENGACLTVYETGKAANLTVQSGAWAFFEDHAVLSGATVNGFLYGADTGTKLSDVQVHAGGTISVSSSATATGTGVYGTMTVSENGRILNTTIHDGATLSLRNKANASDTTVEGNASMEIARSTADGIIFLGAGTQNITKNSEVSGTMFQSGGTQTVSGSNVNLTVFQNGGSQTLDNADASGTVLYKGASQFLTNESDAGGTVAYDGVITIDATSSANDITLHAGSVTVDGLLTDSVIKEAGVLVLNAGSRIGGTITLSGGLVLNGAIDAEFESYDSPSPVLSLVLSDLGKTTVVSDYTLLDEDIYLQVVTDDISAGTYTLAGNAAEFDSWVLLKTGGQESEITIGEIVDFEDYRYSLTSGSSGDLLLNIEEIPTENPPTSLLGNGYSQVLAYDASAGNVGCIAVDGSSAPAWNGIWQFTDASSWSALGSGHFHGSATDKDGVLLLNKENDTLAAWTDLGQADYGFTTLGYIPGFEYRGHGTFGTEATDDILIAKENGAFGILIRGTEYQSVCHVENSEQGTWELIGAGKFGTNGTTTSELLVYHTADNTYTLWRNNDPTFATWNWSKTEIGSADSDWTAAGIGDFQNDGVDDIILLQKSTGYVFAWENGNSQNKRWVGALDSGTEIAAVGDYNADGKADLLIRELNSGWGGLGYWSAGSASGWTELGACVEKNSISDYSIIAG